MPRGVYDRSDSKIRHLQTDLNKVQKEKLEAKSELEVAKIELKAAKRIAEAALPTPTAKPSEDEKFDILRKNLTMLSSTRQVLDDSDQMSPAVMAKFDQEIAAHLAVLAKLREKKFGVVKLETLDDENEPEEESAPRAAAPYSIPQPFQQQR